MREGTRGLARGAERKARVERRGRAVPLWRASTADRGHEPRGAPLTGMLCLERRKGKDKPVIRKALVELDGAPFAALRDARVRGSHRGATNRRSSHSKLPHARATAPTFPAFLVPTSTTVTSRSAAGGSRNLPRCDWKSRLLTRPPESVSYTHLTLPTILLV